MFYIDCYGAVYTHNDIMCIVQQLNLVKCRHLKTYHAGLQIIAVESHFPINANFFVLCNCVLMFYAVSILSR